MRIYFECRLKNLRNHPTFHDIYIFLPAARLFFAFPLEPPRSFRRPRGKAVYSLLNGPGWNSQGGGGRSRFIQAPAMQFMRTLPKYLGTLTFSLNFRNIKGREGERAFARSFVRSDAATTNTRAAGKSRFVYFRFEPRMRQSGVGRHLPRKTIEEGDIAWDLHSTIRT